MTGKRSEQRSDESLLRAAREGDISGFTELWERHRKVAIVAARNIAPSLDPDDIVSEAYLKILELVSRGKGPRGAFRPYLYQVVRSVAIDELRLPEHASDSIDEVPPLHETGPWEDSAFDLNAVSRAFAKLAPRWQSVLWYTEVEGMPPREASKLLGISANSTSALAVRAREALQSAWVEEHANFANSNPECQSTLKYLQRFKRGKLTARRAREVEAHLEECDICSDTAREFRALNSRLGLALGLALLGGSGGMAATTIAKLGLAGVTAGAAGGTTGAGTSLASNTGSGLLSGVSAPAAVIGGVSVAALAVVGSVALAVSLISAPSGPGENAPPDLISSAPPPSDDVDSNSFGSTNSDSNTSSDSASDSAEGNSDSTASEGPPSDPGILQSDRLPGSSSQPDPAPERPSNPDDEPSETPGPDEKPGHPGLPDEPGETPELPVDPTPPLDANLRPEFSPGFSCYEPGVGLAGTSNRYGVLRLRATAPGGHPVEIVDERFDPALSGQPGNEFVNGIYRDFWKRPYDFGFFTKVRLPLLLHWNSNDPELSPVWNTEFVGLSIEDVTLELRLVTHDGRYSHWTEVDTSVTC